MEKAHLRSFCVAASRTGPGVFLGIVVKFIYDPDTPSEVVLIPPPQAEELARLLALYMAEFRSANSDPDSLQVAMKASVSSLTIDEVEAIPPSSVISLVSVTALNDGFFEITLLHASGHSLMIRAKYDFAEWLVGYLLNTLGSIANLEDGSGTLN
jgi:stage V sporulation protein SpoVS